MSVQPFGALLFAVYSVVWGFGEKRVGGSGNGSAGRRSGGSADERSALFSVQRTGRKQVGSVGVGACSPPEDDVTNEDDTGSPDSNGSLLVSSP